MWMVVYITKSERLAVAVEQYLMAEGFLVKRKPANNERASKDQYYEMLVPEAEAQEAIEVLTDKGYL